ncbi:HlyC/CorC family transporter [Hydrocarboniclastica marina]|uniref:HlyC/CorC family transporter n=1 Tax=Hydrocarboniclastica marina TaxID=2259620 RepID=A0A4P7XEB7_9ALTE|nr:HlyC/CorC family transporter [Hydrocarboniclastica marina]MAL99757.1 magnesium/cobalt efflux protein [Alteromonadaceae bacterium]QCF25269.1 HlyC/CorC family transporter [Hydrocarboniclastica marina]
MDDISSTSLIIYLSVLVLLSGFFSSSETGMMALNRYRLKHLAKTGHRGAKNTQRLLERLDRLIGVILIGNNFVNIAASAIATVLCIRLYGDAGIAIATIGLTIIILIFGEVTPKTLAALFPERIAFPASYILGPLLKLLFPLVWLVNLVTAGLMKLMGVDRDEASKDHLSQDELRTIVNEAGALIPKKHRDMLVSILDLEKVTVNDIMVPRNEIVGIDLEDDMESILRQLRASQHTRLPVYRGDINNIAGILHLRNSSKLLQTDELTANTLLDLARDPYFIPESTPLHTQLINFQKAKRRIGVVVDEYGDVLGIATLEDILEEIVGEFTTDFAASSSPDILPQDDGTYIIDGSTHIRAINKALKTNVPTDGPKTLNGLITEALEAIPETNVCLRTAGLRIEVLQIKDNVIRAAKVYPVTRRRRRRKA